MSKGRNVRRKFRSILSGSALEQKLLVRIKYIGYIFSFFLLIIAHRYSSEKVLRRIDEVQRSIKEYRALSISYEAELMRVNRPSVVNERVKASGMEIHDPTKPPRELRVKKIKDDE